MSEIQLSQALNLPLQGKTVVVTRAREQADGFVAKLQKLGAVVIEFPVIQFVAPQSFAPLDELIGRLAQFDWLIFTSANGVAFFWERLGVAGKTTSVLQSVKVCAVGPATADCLREKGVTPDLTPRKFVAEGLLDALGAVAGQKFLLPQADLARETLVTELQARGAIVEQVTAYRTVAATDENSPNFVACDMVQWLQAGKIDLITFTSSSTVRNFAARLATASDKPLAQLLFGVAVACIGPITASTARELGLSVAVEPAEFTTQGMLEAMVKYFSVEQTIAAS